MFVLFITFAAGEGCDLNMSVTYQRTNFRLKLIKKLNFSLTVYSLSAYGA